MSNSISLLGLQWGDEGKGKVVDLLSKDIDAAVRYQGGHNAGHTLIIDGKEVVFHLLPSSICHKNIKCFLGRGVVISLEALFSEIDDAFEFIGDLKDRLVVSNAACLIQPYHKKIDQLRERSRSGTKIGTTGRGIGPAYEDRVGRRSIRVADLYDPKALKVKLEEALDIYNFLIKRHDEDQQEDLNELLDENLKQAERLKPFVGNVIAELKAFQESNKTILFEGAQGILLDIDYGSYPYVTSSSTGAAGIYTGAGVTNGVVTEKLGIVKAYTTRVGEGPMPTEIAEEIGDRIQQIGAEFGATTGRRRRCGWLDLPILKYSVKASSLTSIALTKVDVLSGLEELKVCYAYEIDGKEYDCAYPGLDLSKAKPLYKTLPPFKDDFKNNGKYAQELEEYIQLIEKNLGIPVGIVAYGPERSQIHFRKDYF